MKGQDFRHRLAEAKQATTDPGGLVSPHLGIDLSIDLDEILHATCKAAVELLNVNHSGLVVFDSRRENGHVICEYPSIGTKGLSITLHGVPAEEQMIESRQPIAVTNLTFGPPFSMMSEVLRKHDIQSMLVVPLISNDVVIGSLGLDVIGQPREFTDDEKKLSQLFAKQAAAVIELYRQKAAMRGTALTLKGYSNLRIILDSITRQAVQVMGADDGGVSQFSAERGELTVIADYKFPEYIGTVLTVWEGLAGSVIRKDRAFDFVSDYHSYSERAAVLDKTKRFGAVLMINLRWQNHTVGVLYINAERGRAHPSTLPPLLVLLANTAALAIANAHLSYGSEVAKERIRSSIEAANALALQPDSKRVLQDIANQTLEAANASWVRLIIFDEEGDRHNFLAVRGDKVIDTKDRIRPDGITKRVLKTGQPYLIPDVSQPNEELNDALIEEGCHAAMCFPVEFRSPQHGVVWIHYAETREFSEDQKPLEEYLRQAAMAFDNTRQMETLEPLRQVTESLAAATDTKDVMQRIVTSALSHFKADASVLWPYPDSSSEPILSVREAVTAGVDQALLEEMKDEAIPIGDVTRLVMREGWLPVPEIRETTQTLSEKSQTILRRLGARSFEGLGLLAGGEKLAVLYLVHRTRRNFGDDETRRAWIFAMHAARALKKAKLVDQAARGQMRAAEISALAALVGLEKTLTRIVASVKDILECDAVTLFVYDEETDRILDLISMTGVGDMKLVTQGQEVPRHSIVYRMLERDAPHAVPRVADDELFRVQPFATRENIQAVCAIPLKVDQHRVGVMFVNYRTPHTFASEELDALRPIVQQAAIAIRSGLRYKEENELWTLSKDLLRAKSLEESLRLAVKNAANSLETEFVAIVLLDEDGNTKIPAYQGWSKEEVADYENEPGDNQTIFTTQEGKPIIVQDYFTEKRFNVPRIVKAKGITCGISVPLFSAGKAEGALLAHFLEPDSFLQAKAQPLSLIADFTAIAIQHHQAVQSKLISLSAVKLASDEISKIRLGTDQKEVLGRIVEQAVACLPQSFLGTIQLYDKGRNVLRFESGYSKGDAEQSISLVGEERVLKRNPNWKIGISGRAVLEALEAGLGAECEGKPQIVDNVLKDPDYREYCGETRSALAVPLLTEDGDVLGVLNVESKRIAAYNEEDGEALLAFSKLVVTTIQNAELHRLLEGSTLLAWFGMASSVWGHIVAQKSFNIRNNVTLLRRKLKGHPLEPAVEKLINDKLEAFVSIAEEIRREPIISLLHSAEGLADVNIENLIAERLEKHYKKSPYKKATFNVQFTKTNPIVRCNPDWIKRMLELLIDNALDATSGKPAPVVSVTTTEIEGRQIEIAISDNGPGISAEIQAKLFKQRIEKKSGSKGLGLGLLMVRAIAQIYQGKVGIRQTGPEGTTMYVRLPTVAANKSVPDQAVG